MTHAPDENEIATRSLRLLWRSVSADEAGFDALWRESIGELGAERLALGFASVASHLLDHLRAETDLSPHRLLELIAVRALGAEVDLDG